MIVVDRRKEMYARDGYLSIWSYVPLKGGELLLSGNVTWDCKDPEMFEALPWRVIGESTEREHFSQCGVEIDSSGMQFYRIEVAD